MKSNDPKLTIFYRELDENGNEVGPVFEHPKKYVYWGPARNCVRKNYSRDKFKTKIAERNPWVIYFGTRRCDICGLEHELEETVDGRAVGTTISVTIPLSDIPKMLTYRRTYHRYENVCPQCATKILETIKSLEK